MTREQQYGIIFTVEQLRCLEEVNALIDQFLEKEEDEWDGDIVGDDEDEEEYEYNLTTPPIYSNLDSQPEERQQFYIGRPRIEPRLN